MGGTAGDVSFQDMLAETKNSSSYRAAMQGTYEKDRWAELELEIEESVGREIKRLSIDKAKVLQPLSPEEKRDLDEDEARLRKLADSDDEDSGDDESLVKQERRAREALFDLEQAKAEAKKRYERAKAAAAETRKKAERGIRTYAHPASLASKTLYPPTPEVAGGETAHPLGETEAPASGAPALGALEEDGDDDEAE